MSFVAFKNLVGDQAIFQKAVYVFGNLAVIGLAVYKFHSMGLLPTYQSDWLEFQEPQKVKCDELFDWFSKPVSPHRYSRYLAVALHSNTDYKYLIIIIFVH